MGDKDIPVLFAAQAVQMLQMRAKALYMGQRQWEDMDELIYIAGYIMIGIFLLLSIRTLYRENGNRR